MISNTPKPQTPASRKASDAWDEDNNSEETPTVKDTHEITRKKASMPAIASHPKPVSGNWLNKRYIVNNYILLDSLGMGSYAEVRLCKERSTNKLYAIKIIKKEVMKKKGGAAGKYFDEIKAEIAIMKKLSHPNVLRLYEVMDDPNVRPHLLVNGAENIDWADCIELMEN